MATAITAGRTESAPVRSAEETPSVQTRRVSIDANFVAIASLLALALAAFGYLNSRIDTLGGRLDSVATDLRGEIKQVSTELRTEIRQVGAEAKRYAERTDDKIDRLNEKMDRLTDKLNELIIAQSRAN